MIDDLGALVEAEHDAVTLGKLGLADRLVRVAIEYRRMEKMLNDTTEDGRVAERASMRVRGLRLVQGGLG